MRNYVTGCTMCVVAECVRIKTICCTGVYGGGYAHADCLHITDVCVPIVVYQGVCQCM